MYKFHKEKFQNWGYLPKDESINIISWEDSLKDVLSAIIKHTPRSQQLFSVYHRDSVNIAPQIKMEYKDLSELLDGINSLKNQSRQLNKTRESKILEIRAEKTCCVKSEMANKIDDVNQIYMTQLEQLEIEKDRLLNKFIEEYFNKTEQANYNKR